MANPLLPKARWQGPVRELMAARRAVRNARNARNARDEDASSVARASVDKAKTAPGEREPPWWNGGSPDLNWHMVANTPYAGGSP